MWGVRVTRTRRSGTADVGFALAYVPLLALYGYVGFASPEYDDEFFSIRWIDEFGVGAIGVAQQRNAPQSIWHGLRESWLVPHWWI